MVSTYLTISNAHYFEKYLSPPLGIYTIREPHLHRRFVSKQNSKHSKSSISIRAKPVLLPSVEGEDAAACLPSSSSTLIFYAGIITRFFLFKSCVATSSKLEFENYPNQVSNI